jgi:hypothetical protein
MVLSREADASHSPSGENTTEFRIPTHSKTTAHQQLKTRNAVATEGIDWLKPCKETPQRGGSADRCPSEYFLQAKTTNQRAAF